MRDRRHLHGCHRGAAYAAGLGRRDARAFHGALRQARLFPEALHRQVARQHDHAWSARAPSVIDNVTLFEMLLRGHALRFRRLKIPFLAIATDFYAIEQVVLDKGH
jgi:predicted acylesterase/phospholipase RssA